METSSPTPAKGRVVVGVDGSTGGQQALATAAQEAVMRGARLDVVHAWRTPYLVSPIGTIVLPLDDSEQESDAMAVLDLSIRDALGDPRSWVVPVEKVLVKDTNPARVLLDVAKGAELLVVGSRGLGGFAGLLLGSVSNQCVHHAGCPVLVVRTPA